MARMTPFGVEINERFKLQVTKIKNNVRWNCYFENAQFFFGRKGVLKEKYYKDVGVCLVERDILRGLITGRFKIIMKLKKDITKNLKGAKKVVLLKKEEKRWE